MLDIKGIKQKIDEVVQIAESSNDRTAEILANNLATIDDDFYNEFVSNGGDDSNFKTALKSCCEEWVYNSSFQYGESQPSYGNPWVKANKIYFNLDDIWDDWRGYCENLPDYEKVKKPENTGEDYLEEQVLMEMPATNYQTFDVEPYILCDEEYNEDEDGNIIEDMSWMPFQDYINHNGYVPSWVKDMFGNNRNYNLVPLPKLNLKFDSSLVQIVGIAGYYEGMSVGIITRDIDDVDVWCDYFDETEDDNGDMIYIPRWGNFANCNREEARKYLEKLLDDEIIKARDVLIEAHSFEGGKMVPSDYAYVRPEKSGDEFNECKQYNKKMLTETPMPNWAYMSLGPGDNFSDEYCGYPIFIECFHDDDAETEDDEIYYVLQIFDPSSTSDDPIDESSFSYWNSMINYLKNYVSQHSIAKDDRYDEPDTIKKPEKTGDEFNESVQMNESSQSDTLYHIHLSPGDHYETIYKGYSLYINCFVEVNSDDDEATRYYELKIYDKNDEYKNEPLSDTDWAYWDDLIDYLENYIKENPYTGDYDEPENIEKPIESGDEFDESLDIKGIKKQINEIVRMSDGNN